MSADNDVILAKLAIERGHLTQQQVADALDVQKTAREQLGRRHQYGGFRGSPCSLQTPYGTVSRSSE